MSMSIGVASLSFGKPNDQIVDEALIERCRKQDYEAFGKLVDAYQNRVYGFVRKMVPTGEDAEDITQEVFIRAFQSFTRFDARSSVRTWLFRIAHNLCIDRARKTGRSPDQVSLVISSEIDEEFEIPDNRWQPEEALANEALMDHVEKGIHSMSEKLRSVLLLHDREDMQYDEISSVLGIPMGTVKSRLFLARAHLQNYLKDYLDLDGGNHAK